MTQTNHVSDLFYAIRHDAANNCVDVAEADLLTCYIGTIEGYCDDSYQDKKVPEPVARLCLMHVDNIRALIASETKLPADCRLSVREIFNRLVLQSRAA